MKHIRIYLTERSNIIMDKKKAIGLLEKIDLLVHDYIDGEKQDELQNIVAEALEELQKPDWISVEDELPKYCEQVLVIPNNIRAVPYATCRVRSNRDYELDKNNFIKLPPFMGLDITHWRKIDKLEV